MDKKERQAALARIAIEQALRERKMAEIAAAKLRAKQEAEQRRKQAEMIRKAQERAAKKAKK